MRAASLGFGRSRRLLHHRSNSYWQLFQGACAVNTIWSFALICAMLFLVLQSFADSGRKPLVVQPPDFVIRQKVLEDSADAHVEERLASSNSLSPERRPDSYIRGGGVQKPWVEKVSDEPRAYLYHNILTPAECAHLRRAAAPQLEKSSVVDSSTGGSMDSEVRTSSGTFLRRGADEVVRGIEERISTFTQIPVENGEGLQILRYGPGQKYDAHFDYFYDAVNTRNGGQRMATMLMYLSTPEEGGETVFPAGKQLAEGKGDADSGAACTSKGPFARAREGDAVLFWSTNPDASLDPHSLHAACPVVRGEKWAAVKWMRLNEYRI